MKNLFVLYIVLLFSLIACNNEVEDEVLTPSINQPINFIDLFQDSTLLDTIKLFTAVKEVGASGGILQLEEQIEGGPFGSISISATLEIEPGTIPANETFMCSLTVDNVKASIQISPIEKHFAHPFKLNLKYTGVDLQKVNANILDFLCLNGYPVVYNCLSADFSTGTLEAKDVVVPCFSLLENFVTLGFVGEFD